MSNNRYVQWKTNNPDSYEEVLRRRRERYSESEEYRNRQLQHTAEWREKQKKAKKKAKKKTLGKRTPKPKMFEVGGAQIECWSAGRCAEFLGIDKKTITNLEQRGTIPTNHIVAKNRRRWWPAEFMRWLKPYFDQKTRIPSEEFHRRVWTGWSEARVCGLIPVIPGVSNREESSDDGETSDRGVDS